MSLFFVPAISGISLFVQICSSYNGTSQVGLALTLMASFYLNPPLPF
jgi:hypothetical protein